MQEAALSMPPGALTPRVPRWKPKFPDYRNGLDQVIETWGDRAGYICSLEFMYLSERSVRTFANGIDHRKGRGNLSRKDRSNRSLKDARLFGYSVQTWPQPFTRNLR
jgi:hypothetical protein